jgi:hypothetical protein
LSVTGYRRRPLARGVRRPPRLLGRPALRALLLSVFRPDVVRLPGAEVRATERLPPLAAAEVLPAAPRRPIVLLVVRPVVFLPLVDLPVALRPADGFRPVARPDVVRPAGFRPAAVRALRPVAARPVADRPAAVLPAAFRVVVARPAAFRAVPADRAPRPDAALFLAPPRDAAVRDLPPRAPPPRAPPSPDSERAEALRPVPPVRDRPAAPVLDREAPPVRAREAPSRFAPPLRRVRRFARTPRARASAVSRATSLLKLLFCPPRVDSCTTSASPD